MKHHHFLTRFWASKLKLESCTKNICNRNAKGNILCFHRSCGIYTMRGQGCKMKISSNLTQFHFKVNALIVAVFKMFLFWGLVWHLARISGIMTIQSCRKRQVERDLWRSSCSPVLEVQWASWSKRVTCSSLRLSFERLQVLHYENRAKYLMSYTDFFKMKYICFCFFLRLSPADFQSWIFTFHDWSAGALWVWS